MADEPRHAWGSCALQIPTFGFLYVAGYIGYVGRQYILTVKKEAKPTDKEIIIDVPLALKLAFQGWGWPLATVQVRMIEAAGLSIRQHHSTGAKLGVSMTFMQLELQMIYRAHPYALLQFQCRHVIAGAAQRHPHSQARGHHRVTKINSLP
jgi:hypothetical protein